MGNSCSSFEWLIARAADAAMLTDSERRALEVHMSGCEACRQALEHQRQVARVLQARVASDLRPGFAARLSSRLDREDEGMLGLANWRAWTTGLAPLAAALVLAAYVGVGVRSSDAGSADTSVPADAASLFEGLSTPAGDSSPASVFLQPSTSGEVLLETVLTGSAPAATGEGRDVR